MTNTPSRSTHFEQLVDHLNMGNTVKVGDWTISNAKQFDSPDSMNRQVCRFVATLENEIYHSGQAFEAMIALKPAERENFSGLKVDLSVEIHAKLESHFEGLGFSTPIGNPTISRAKSAERPILGV